MCVGGDGGGGGTNWPISPPGEDLVGKKLMITQVLW